ncbi:hypothetical protein NP92_05605 [Anoxybacillus gonensis]|uniref:Uncharacterized protein n=1 Tax=Anoxybacillus gonensis TaxID=198467 RepID=A0AAW7TC48_9BACL|nr:hypothetical protein [Anoxybacillus gonensis]AKS39102.1 hypothetical protein AFK25_11055 [Anoxybacillus gonensis]KGP61219.1 hypothetical protein NP92_05605 [Anoxybacillus gonensis]MDO0876869.1 hypothetical protein [Anoxybacillus gonensis]
MNERGYSLVLVMLTVTVFFIIGLTILSVSIYQAKFTQVRVEDVTSLHDAVKAVEETVAELKVKVEQLTLSTPAQLDVDLGNAQVGFLNELMNRHGVTIEDITDEKGIVRNHLFTRVFRISAPYGNKAVTREVIITNAPSFLKYALGSRENVTLNGGAYIDGNIYAGKDIYVTNVANYIYNSTLYSVQTSFPTTSEKSILFVDGNRYACDHENGAKSCYTISNEFTKNMNDFSSSSLSFQYQGPSIQKEQEEFIDVNFDFTLKDKLLSAAGIDAFDQSKQTQYQNLISLPLSELVEQLKPSFAFVTVDDATNLPTALDVAIASGKSIFLDTSTVPYFDITSFTLNDGQWLIVNGDLTLENAGSSPLQISGNIIVLGNLTITGQVAFDSTIYVNGNTSIYNTTISGLNGKEVVLLTKEELEIARVNEFTNNFSLTTPNLKGFFYTDSNAVIYAVGSYINIEGGLFARGNGSIIPYTDENGLIINTYRGETNESGTNLSFQTPISSEEDQKQYARFVVKHNKDVFINRGLGLPLVKQLAVIVDELRVQ